MHNEFMHTLRSEALQGASIRVGGRAGGRRSLMLRAEDGICADVPTGRFSVHRCFAAVPSLRSVTLNSKR